MSKLSAELKKKIRETLVRLYNSRDRLSLAASDSGLDLSKISDSSVIQVYCNKILEEAINQGKAVELLENAIKDYPFDTELRELLERVKNEKETTQEELLVPVVC